MIQQEVVLHYAYKKKISLEESSRLHEKLFDFLTRAVQSKTSLQPTVEIDEVWHNFILHTRLYAEFCSRTFNSFIHHNPRLPDAVNWDNFNNHLGVLECNTEEDKCDVGVSFAKEHQIAACEGGGGGGDSCDSQVIKFNLIA